MRATQRADDVQVFSPALCAQRDIAPGDAEPERLHGFRCVRCRFRWRTGECFARSRKLGLFGTVGKNAVVTNAREADGKHMQQEAADKLARVAKMEASDTSVSVDLLVKSPTASLQFLDNTRYERAADDRQGSTRKPWRCYSSG